MRMKPFSTSFENLLNQYLDFVPENYSDYGFLKIIHTDYFILGPGLGDQTWQLQIYLKIAYSCNLILELPQRNLQSSHNAGRAVPLNWNDYVDFRNSNINGEPLSRYATSKIKEEDLSKTLFIRTLSEEENNRTGLNSFDQYFQSNESGSIEIEFARPEWVLTGYNFLRLKYPDKFQSVIHIRRGDRVASCGLPESNLSAEQYDRLTQAENILKKLKQNILNKLKDLNCTIENIYVMTDMLKGDPVIDDLNSSDFNFTYYFDYPELCSLKEENNYKLYLLEEEIHSKAVFKVYNSHWLN